MYNEYENNIKKYDYLKITNPIINKIKLANSPYLNDRPKIYFEDITVSQFDCSTRTLACLLDKKWRDVFNIQLEEAKKELMFPNTDLVMINILKKYNYKVNNFESISYEEKPMIIDFILKHPNCSCAFINSSHAIAYKNYTIYDDIFYNNKYIVYEKERYENNENWEHNLKIKLINYLFTKINVAIYKEGVDETWSLDFLK